MGIGKALKKIAGITPIGLVARGIKSRIQKDKANQANIAAQQEAQAAQDLETLRNEGARGGADFAKLAQERLGGIEKFAASERAQEELLRRQGQAQTAGVLRALQGRLAGQGVRGGAALAAQRTALNQGAQTQGDIARQLIAGRGEREQALRQQLLGAELAGRQFGQSGAAQAIAGRLGREQTRASVQANRGFLDKIFGI